MSAPKRTPAPVPPEHQRLYDAVERLGRRALARYRLPDADGDEVIACYLFAVSQRWPAYRADAGTPAQWLLGVLRNEILVFLRKRSRHAECDRAWVELSDTYMPHPRTAELNELMAKLTPIERRIVWWHEAEGYSFGEIAFLEGKSKTQVHRIHAAAMEKLRAEAGTHPLLVLMAAYAASLPPERTPEENARFWQRFMAKHGAELGIQHPRDLFPAPEESDDPPESGVCRPGPSSRPPPGPPSKLRALRWVGPLVGLLFAVPAADATLGAHQDEALAMSAPSTPAAAPVAVAGTATSAFATASGAEDATSTGSILVVVSSAPGAALPAPEARLGGPAYKDPVDSERAVLQRWREAAAIGDVGKLCVALKEHARRFPQGQSAIARDRLWSASCAERRTAER